MKNPFGDDGEDEVGQLTTEGASELSSLYIQRRAVDAVVLKGPADAIKIGIVTAQVQVVTA